MVLFRPRVDTRSLSSLRQHTVRRPSEIIRVQDIQAAGGGEAEFEAFDGKLKELYTPGREKLASKQGHGNYDFDM